MTTRTIQVDYLARVEGEGALTLKLDAGKVISAQLKLFEPPRLFEAMLRGRACTEAPDLTARICGICPVAYQMSSCHAVEHALGVRVTGALRELRRLMYCGEWIESHVLHMIMLHAPDFLGLPDAMALAKLHPERVKGALQVKKTGNALVATLGGREIHPINVRVGGFYRAPSKQELRALVPELETALGHAEELLDWLSTLEFPSFSRDYELVSLQHPSEYPMNEGRLVSTHGLDCEASQFGEHIVEEQVPYSTALHARLVERGVYQVGPLARFVNNVQQLSPRALAAASRVGLDPSCRNPFHMLLVRGVETVYALGEALRIVQAYEPPSEPAVALEMRAGVGHAITEAPRGLLYHRYVLDEHGLITDAQLVPPTSQNQGSMELDLVAMGDVLLEPAAGSGDTARRARRAQLRSMYLVLDTLLDAGLRASRALMPAPVIVCFGQRGAGDDAVGLSVADQLGREGVAARASGDATLLLDLLAQGQRVIVVDAVVCAVQHERRVLHLRPAALASAGVSPVSCHGLGVAEALALAEVLYGASATQVDIVAIPIARPNGAVEQLSAAAESAVAEACALVHELLKSHRE